MELSWKMRFILLMVGLSLSNGVPIGGSSYLDGSNRCLQHCSNTNWWRYEVGKVYKYDYLVSTSTTLKGTSDQESAFSFRARAEIGVDTPCNFVLRLSSVSLVKTTGEDESGAFAAALERRSIQFGFNNGRVENVCGDSEDPLWVLNLKKGVISAFQQTMTTATASENVLEEDVVGRCETRYTPSGVNWGKQTFKKVKDMASCTNNQQLFQYALNLPDMNIQHLPMLGSTHECQVRLSEGHLDRSECQEVHQFKPFSKEGSGSTTSVTQILHLLGIKKKKVLGCDQTVRTNLLYVHDFKRTETIADEEFVKSILNQYEHAREADKPSLFQKLVYSLRNLKHSELVRIYHNIEEMETKKFVQDALPILKTDSAIALMKEVILRGELPEKIIDSWFSSLAFYKNPSRAMLAVLSVFLDDAPRQSTLLGISALVNTFCANNKNCDQVAEVKEIVHKYEALMGNSCEAPSQEEQEKMVLVLKGIRNIGYVINAGDVLKRCYLTKSNSMWVRVAALDTVKKMTCQPDQHRFEYPNELTTTFRDTEEDSEMRIGAYLALISCPSEQVVDIVKAVLLNEPVNQVGSFVWTHLTNLQETKSKEPAKIILKKMIGSEFMQNKWNTDARKFSRNMEMSYFFNNLKVGGTFDSNIIFSQHSYIPRSAMINLTASLFGEDINLFEIGARIEGFEKPIEDLFGPDGYFREDTFHKLLKGFRDKRHVKDESLHPVRAKFAAQVQEEAPRGNLYMRFFGKDIKYSAFNGIPSIFTESFLSAFNFFGIPIGVQEKEFKYSKSTLLLDGSIITPTSVGLPLNMTVNGTSTVRLHSKMRLDIENIFKLGEADIKAEIYPSATMEVSAIMSVDAFVTKTGLKSTTRLHSSSFIDGHVRVQGRRLATATINIPKEKMEIFDASVDFFTYNNDAFHKLESKHPKLDVDICTPTVISDIFGLQSCLQGSYHHGEGTTDPNWYFSGPTKASLFIRKTDNFDKFVFTYEWTSAKKNPARGTINKIDIEIDTPGSAISRRSKCELEYNDVGNYFMFGLDVPVKNMKIDVNYDWVSNKKMIAGSILVGEMNIFSFSQLFNTYPSKYEMVSQLIYYNDPILDWVGSVHISNSGKYSADGTLKSIFIDDIVVLVDLTRDDFQTKLVSKIESKNFEFGLDGQVGLQNNVHRVNGIFTYKLFGGNMYSIDVDGKFSSKELGMLTTNKFAVTINPSQFPQWVTDIKWLMQLSPDYVENRVQTSFGSTKWNIEQKYNAQANRRKQNLQFLLKLKKPQSSQEYMINFHHMLTLNSSSNTLTLKLSPTIWFEIYGKHNYTDSPYVYEVEGGIKVPSKEIKAGFNLAEPTLKEYVGDVFGQWDNKHINLDFHLARDNHAVIDYIVNASARITGYQPVQVNGRLVLKQDKNSANVNWQHQGKNYMAEVEYSPTLNETEVKGALELDKEKYGGTIIVKNNDYEKSILIDLKSKRHIYIKAGAKYGFTDVILDVYLDKDVDPSQHGKIMFKLLDGVIQAEVKYFHHHFKVIGTYTPTSATAVVEWAGERAEFEGKFDTAPSTFDIILGVKTPFQHFNDIRIQTMVVKTTNKMVDDGYSTFDSKVELKWNHHHHHLTVKGKKGEKTEGNMVLTSTYAPIDHIAVSFEHQQNEELLYLKGFGTYKQKEIFVELKHMSDNTRHAGPVATKIAEVMNGNFCLRTPLPILESITGNYSLLVNHTTGDIKATGEITRNSVDTIKIKVNGVIKPRNYLVQVNVEHPFGSKIPIAAKAEYNSGEDEMLVNAKLKYGATGFEFNTRQVYIPFLEGNISCNIISPSTPMQFMWEFSHPEKNYFFKSSTKWKNNMIYNIDFKTIYRSRSDFKSETMVNFKNHSLTFTFLQSNMSSLFDLNIHSSGNPIIIAKLDKVRQESKLIISGKLHTPYEMMSGINIHATMEALNQKSNSNIVITYKDKEITYVSHSNTASDGNFNIQMKIDSNIMEIRKISLYLGKMGVPDRIKYEIKTQLNSQKFDSNIEMIKKSANNGQVTVAFFGPWGRNRVIGEYKVQQNKYEGKITYTDSVMNVFEMSAIYQKKPHGFGINLNFVTPFNNDVLKIAIEKSSEHGQYGMITIESDKKFLDLFFDIKKDGQKFLLNSHIKSVLSTKNIFPDMKITGEIGLSHDVSSMINHKGSVGVEAKLTIENLSKSGKVEINFSGAKSPNDLKIKILIHTPVANFKTLTGEMYINIPDKIASLTFLRNEYRIAGTCSLTITGSGVTAEITINTPFSNFQFVKVLVKADIANKKFTAKFERNIFVIGVSAGVTIQDGLIDIEAKVESSTHSWKEITFLGKIDLSSETKTIKFGGNSKDGSHMLDIDAQLTPSTGNLKMLVDLPIIEVVNKDVKIEYERSSECVTFKFDFSGSIIEGDLAIENGTTVIFEGKTTFSGFEAISVKATYEKDNLLSGEKHHIEVETKINENQNSLNFTCLPFQEVFFNIKTSYKSLRNIRGEIKYTTRSGQIIFGLNDYFFQLSTNVDKVKPEITFIAKSSSFHYVVKYMHTWTKDVKEVLISLTVANRHYEVHIKVDLSNVTKKDKTNLIFKLVSPFTKERLVKISWHPKEMIYKIQILKSGYTVIKANFQRECERGCWDGRIQFNLETIYGHFRNATFDFDYNLFDVPHKNFELKMRSNGFFLELNSTFEARHDKFNGTTIMKSSISNWEDVILGASWDIKSNPEAMVSIEKNGEKKVIDIKIELSQNVIPRTVITTPFVGYEKIVIGGNYKNKSGIYTVSIHVEKNGFRLLEFTSSLKVRDDWKFFDLTSKFISTIPDFEDLQLQVLYKLTHPIAVNVIFTNKLEIYSLLAMISLEDMAFDILFKTPIIDFEEFSLAGQFGTTSMKTIYSFNRNGFRQKRSVSLSMQNNGRVADFNFETQGIKTDFAFGIKYDFQQFMTSGNIIAHIVYPDLNVDFKSKLEYQNIDGNFENGFSTQLFFYNHDTEVVSGTIVHNQRRTVATLTTPVAGWKNIYLEFSSDYVTNASIVFIHDNSTTKLVYAKMGSQNIKIDITTPFQNYESVTIIYKGGLNTYDIVVKRDTGNIFSFNVKVNVTMSGIIPTGTFDVDFKGPDPKWNAHLHTSYGTSNGTFKLTTNLQEFKVLEFHIDITKIGSSNEITFNGKMNDHHFSLINTNTNEPTNKLLTYETKTTIETNIQWFGWKKMIATSTIHFIGFSNPMTAKFKRIDDGHITFEFETSFELKDKGRTGQTLFNTGVWEGVFIQFNYKGDLPVMNEKVDFLVMLDIQKNESPLIGRFYKATMDGKFNSNDFKMEFSPIADTHQYEASVKFTSNIPNLEKLEGNIRINSPNGTINFTLDFRKNGLDALYLKGYYKPLMENLSLNIVIPALNINEDVKLFMSFQEHKSELKLHYTGIGQIEMDAMVDIVKMIVDITIDNIGQNRKWQLLAKADLKSVSPLLIDAVLVFKTPFWEDYSSSLKFDFTQDMKIFGITFAYGKITAVAKANIMLTLSKSDIHVEAICPRLGLKAFRIRGRRNSFRKINYELNFNGKDFYLLNINEVGNKKFDIKVELKMPIYGMEMLSLHIMKTKNSNGAEGYASVKQNKNEVTILYDRRNSNIALNLTTSFSQLSNVVLQTEIEHCEHYNFKVQLNDYRINLKNTINCETKKVLIEYTTSFPQFAKFSLNVIPFNYFKIATDLSGKITKISGKFKPGELNMDLDISGSKFKTMIVYKFDAGNIFLNIEFIHDYSTKIQIKTYLDRKDSESASFGINIITPFQIGKSIDITGNYVIQDNIATHYLEQNIDDNINNLTIIYTNEKAKKIANIVVGLSSGQTMEMNAALKTPNATFAEFILDFKNPFVSEQLINIEAKVTANSNSVRFGNIKFDYYGELYEFNMNINSNQDHIYLEVKTPIPTHRNSKMDINFGNGNLKLTLLIGAQKVVINFNRKITIFNFDILAQFEGKVYTFKGKVDIGGRELKTFASWDRESMSMKATYYGNKISISLKSPFKNFERLKFGGSWNEIKNGFSVSAASANHLFEAKFTRDLKKTTGYWKAQRNNEEIKFVFNVDKSSTGMGVRIELHAPDHKTFLCEARYTMDKDHFGGDITLDLGNIMNKTEAMFEVKYKGTKTLIILSSLTHRIKICSGKVILNYANLNNLILKIEMDVPMYDKRIGAEFVFKPRAWEDFEFVSRVMIDRVSHGASIKYQRIGYKMDSSFSINSPQLSVEHKFGFEYSMNGRIADGKQISDGKLVFYLDKTRWEVSIISNHKDFLLKTEFNIGNFVHTAVNQFISFTFPVGKPVKFEVQYLGNTRIKSGQIVAAIENRNMFFFKGKIDPKENILETYIYMGNERLLVKVSNRKNRVLVVLKSPFENFKKIRFEGKVENIGTGYNIIATSNMNGINHIFEAQYVMDSSNTTGFWKVNRNNEEIRFDFYSKTDVNGSDIFISLKPLQHEIMKFHIKFLLKEELMKGTIKMNLGDILNITEHIPEFPKNMEITFMCKPKDFHDFEFFSQIVLGTDIYGGGLKYQKDGYKVDAEINMNSPILNLNHAAGWEYSMITNITGGVQSTTGAILLYFDETNWEVNIDTKNQNFSVRTQFNLGSLVHIVIGNFVSSEFPPNQMVKIEVEYNNAESIAIFAKIESIGDLSFSLSTSSEKVIGRINAAFINQSFNKSATFSLMHGSNGKFEFTISDEDSKIILETASDGPYLSRRVRAAIQTPDFGTMDYIFDTGKSKGVVVLTTKKGRHQFSYSIRRMNGYEVTLNVESPYVDNGSASSKFIINTIDNVYKCRLSLNNDHFVSGHIDIKESAFNSKFVLETTHLPYKVELIAEYYDGQTEIAATVGFTYSSDHYATVKFDKKDRILTIDIKTKYIPFETLFIETGLKFDKNIRILKFSLLVKYGSEKIKFAAKLIRRRILDIDGEMSFSASKYTSLKGSVDFGFNYEDKTLHFEVTTAHSKFPKLRFNARLITTASQFEGVIVLSLPISGYDMYELHLKTDNAPIIPEKNIEISIFTPDGEYILTNSWNLTQTDFLYQLQIDAPQKTYFIQSKTTWGNKLASLSSFDLPYLRNLVFDVNTVSLDAMKNIVTLKVDWEKQTKAIDILIDYNLKSGVSVVGMLNAHNFRPATVDHFKITVGFDMNQRKMIKAHVEYPNGKNKVDSVGIKADYFFNSSKDFVSLFKVDFPSPQWTDVTIDIANQIKDGFINVRFGGKLKQSQLSFALLNKILDPNHMKCRIVALINDHKLLYSHAGGISESLNSDFHIHSSFIEIANRIFIEKTNKGLDINTNLEVNGDKIITVSKNSLTKMINARIQKIGFPFLLATTFTYNLHESNFFSPPSIGTIAIKTNFCWDLLKMEEKSLIVETQLRKVTTGGDFTIKIKIPKEEVFTLRANNENKGNKTYNSFGIFRGEKRSLAYDLFTFRHFTEVNEKRDERITITLPVYTVEYNSHMIEKMGRESSSFNILWGKTGSELSGIGVLLSNEMIGDKKDTTFIVRRPIGRRFDDHTLAVVLHSKPTGAVLNIKVEHHDPAKQISIKVETFFANDIQKIKARFKVGYTVAGSSFKFIGMAVRADKLNKVFEAIVRNSQNAIKFEGKLKSRKKVHTGDLTGYYNNLKFFSIASEFNGKIPAANIEIMILGQSTINFFVGLKSDTNAVMQVTHTALGADVEDIKLHIALFDGDKISSTITWRKEVLDDMKTFITKIIHDIDATTSEPFWIDMEKIHHILYKASQELVDDLVYVSNLELKHVFEKVKVFSEYIRSFKTKYERDIDLSLLGYIADSLDVFADVGINYSNEVQNIIKLIARVNKIVVEAFFARTRNDMMIIKYFFFEVKAYLFNNLKSANLHLDNAAKKLEEAIAEFKKIIEYVVTKYKEFVQRYTGEIYTFIKNLLVKMKGDLLVQLQYVFDYVRQFKIIQEILDLYDACQSWLHQMNFTQHLQNSVATIRRIFDNEYITKFKVRLSNLWISLRTLAMDYYNAISDYPPVAFATSVARTWIQVFRDLIASHLHKYNVRSFFDGILTTFNIYTSTAIRIFNIIYYEKDFITYELDFQPAKGHLQYIQMLPMNWENFHYAPKFLPMFGIQEPANIDVTKFYFQVMENLDSITRAISTRTVLPPFSAIAMITGSNQIITFDNKLYEFAGECSYLLASDFSHNRFSVIANYKMEKKESLSILVDGKVIDIFNDGKVTVDRIRIELPKLISNSYIKREGNMIQFHNKLGLKVDCNLIHDVCSVKISGWYFGKSGGLFGVYDNEPNNDWMTSDRRVVEDLHLFAESWQVGQPCQVRYLDNPQRTAPLALTKWDEDKCFDFFSNEESLLMPCFTTVDPTPFHTMCKRQMNMKSSKKVKNRGFCQVAAAYIEKCKQKDHELWMPGGCVNCNIPNKHLLRGGESVSYHNNAPRKADVAIVVQQGSCLNNLHLSSVVPLIESSLKEAYIVDNMYSVIGYGGKNELIEPHVYTSANEIFNDGKSIIRALQGLSNVGSDGSVYEAMQYAGRMTYRSGVAKMMVVVTCQPIYDGSFYGDAMTMLSENNFIMHYVTPANLTLRQASKKAVIYGYDKTSVYTQKHLNSKKGDRTLRRQMKVPKDYISALATETGGSVFSQYQMDNNQVSKKKAMSVFGRRAAQSSNPTTCQVCDCVSDREGLGRVICQKCFVPAIDLVLHNWNKYSRGGDH